MKIDVQKITPKNLRIGKYENLLSEFYDLKNVVENSLWHDNQTVFDHVVLVYEELIEVLDLEFLEDKRKKEIKKNLDKKIENRTRKELLKISTLLHDIGKIDTAVKNEEGIVYCPQHEMVGSSRVKKFTKRFDLTKKEEEFVKNIVLYHGFISEILNLILLTNKFAKYLCLFKETVGDIGLELILLMYSDLLGSDLEKNSKKDFEDRENLLIKMIQEYEV